MILSVIKRKFCFVNKKSCILKKLNKVQKKISSLRGTKSQGFIQKTIVKRKKKKWNFCKNKIFSLKRKLMIFNCVCAKSKWNWTEWNSLLMKNSIFSKSTRKSWRNSNWYRNLIHHHQNKVSCEVNIKSNAFQKRRKWHNFLISSKYMVLAVKRQRSCCNIT